MNPLVKDAVQGGVEGIVGPVANLIDNLFTSDEERERAKLALLSERGRQAIGLLNAQLGAIVAEANSADPWTSRARPSFLYVIYVLILWSLPMGILSAFAPDVAARIIHGMTTYLAAIPEALYALFGTGYLGYTAARQWGKAKGSDR
jgi:hypothetical protein